MTTLQEQKDYVLAGGLLDIDVDLLSSINVCGFGNMAYLLLKIQDLALISRWETILSKRTF